MVEYAQPVESPSWATVPTAVVAPLRRLRGLRFPAVPSWPLLAQWGGGVSMLVGVYQLWGSAVTLITGGIVAAALGALREAGKV